MEYNPKIAEACPYLYYWLAKFADGEEVAQYTPKGEEVLYREVLSRLEGGRGLLFVKWVPVKAGIPSYTLYLQPWQRPIVLRRHFDTEHLRTGKMTKRIFFLLGWQATIAGKNYKSIMLIDPLTGSVEVKAE